MNHYVSSLIVATFSALTITIAEACEPMHAGLFGTKLFAEMDSNKDGVITKKEFDAFQNKYFKEIDANHDGKITIEEFEAAHPPMHKDHCDENLHGLVPHHEIDDISGDEIINKRFDSADTNHDGALSREEAKNTPMILQHFDDIDANKDGKVTEEELKAWMEGHDAVPEKADKAPEKK